MTLDAQIHMRDLSQSPHLEPTREDKVIGIDFASSANPQSLPPYPYILSKISSTPSGSSRRNLSEPTESSKNKGKGRETKAPTPPTRSLPLRQGLVNPELRNRYHKPSNDPPAAKHAPLPVRPRYKFPDITVLPAPIPETPQQSERGYETANETPFHEASEVTESFLSEGDLSELTDIGTELEQASEPRDE
ncbi:hypothetical protein BDZ97DRAFT_2080077 [Flammula alnicola]|nr:hypothetical protein BDZ97DRAFT_2080077 [Flammula alnicola]